MRLVLVHYTNPDLWTQAFGGKRITTAQVIFILQSTLIDRNDVRERWTKDPKAGVDSHLCEERGHTQ